MRASGTGTRGRAEERKGRDVVKRKKQRKCQQDLFGQAEPQKPIRDWRAVPLDDLPEDQGGLAALEDRLVALTRRNRAFFRALSIAGVSLGTEDREAFEHSGFVILGNLALLRQRRVKTIEVPDVLEGARRADRELTERRRRILAHLPPEVCRRVLGAEPRVRIHDFEILNDAARVDFSWALEQGEIELGEDPPDNAE